MKIHIITSTSPEGVTKIQGAYMSRALANHDLVNLKIGYHGDSFDCEEVELQGGDIYDISTHDDPGRCLVVRNEMRELPTVLRPHHVT